MSTIPIAEVVPRMRDLQRLGREALALASTGHGS